MLQRADDIINYKSIVGYGIALNTDATAVRSDDPTVRPDDDPTAVGIVEKLIMLRRADDIINYKSIVG